MASVESNASRQQGFGAGVASRSDGRHDNPLLNGSVATVKRTKPTKSTADLQKMLNDLFNESSAAKLERRVQPTTSPVAQTPAAPPQPTTPAPVAPKSPSANAQLPSDPVVADRGNRRPDYTLLDGVRNPGMGTGQAGMRANVLSAVYRLPADGQRGVRSLQSFNGPRGERLTLGR